MYSPDMISGIDYIQCLIGYLIEDDSLGRWAASHSSCFRSRRAVLSCPARAHESELTSHARPQKAWTWTWTLSHRNSCTQLTQRSVLRVVPSCDPDSRIGDSPVPPRLNHILSILICTLPICLYSNSQTLSPSVPGAKKRGDMLMLICSCLLLVLFKV